MLALIACTFGARADELTVANGSATNSNVPISGLYCDNTDTYSQTIYSSTMLADMAGTEISAVKYYLKDSETLNANLKNAVLQLSLKEVSIDAFVNYNSVISGMAAVATYTIAGGESELVFNFTEPFAYSGENNLVIEVKVLTKSGYKTTYWKGEDQTTITSIYRAGSGNTAKFIPKTTFTYENAAPVDYKASVSPNAIDFGKLAPNASASQTITIKNKGTNAITPSLSGISAPFSTNYVSTTINGGDELTFNVTFNPTEIGTYNQTLTIDCGYTDGIFNVALSGTSAKEITIADGTVTSEYLPIYGWNHGYYLQQNQFVYPASMMTSFVGKKLKSITFYPAEVSSGYSTYKGVNFYNGSVTISLASVEEGSITFTSSENIAQSPEGLTQVGTITMPQIPQTNLTEWTITFGEEGYNYYGGDLLVDVTNVKGNDGRTYFYGITTDNYSGYYCSSSTAKTGSKFLPKATFSFEDAPELLPIYTMEVTSSKAIDCGSVIGAGNAVATEKLVVKNTGNQPVKPVITLSGDNAGMFTINPAEAAELAPRKSAEYTITFTAPEGTEAGEYTANVAITDDNGNAAAIEDVTVKGTVVAPVISGTVTPETLEFTIPAEKTTTGIITIANTGNTAFTPVFSALEAPFSIDEATEIAAGESKEFTITYAPVEEGTNEATLNVTIGTQEPVAVTLNGVATEPTSEVVVCDKTNTNPYIPFYSFWADTYLVESQFIYPAEKLTGLNGRKITGIKFFAETNVKATGGKLQISLKETDQTVFATYAGEDKVTEMTIAGTSVPSNSTNELEFIFNEPIAYNGGNLAIEVIALEKSTNCDKTYWLGESQSSTTATSYYAYGNYGGLQYFLPKAEFGTIAGGGPVEEEITLAELCRSGVITEGENEYTIKDLLIGVYADDVKGILWCKDQGNASIFSTSILDGQVDFLKDDPQAQNGRDWDQSNWIALHFSTPTATNNIGQLVNGAVNRYIKPGTVKGKLIDDVNYALRMDLDQLELVTQADDPDINPDYIPNVYCPANFMPTNLNIWGNDEDGGYTTGSDQNYFFMNPKIQEICEVTYAQWDAINGYFTVPTSSGFDGAFYIGTGYNVIQSQNFTSSLQDEHIYKFKAIVQRSDKDNYGPKNVTTPATGITLYPVDLNPSTSEIPTAINTINVNGEVKSVKYYNVAGIESDVPFQGVNIEVTTYTDGSRTTRKIMK